MREQQHSPITLSWGPSPTHHHHRVSPPVEDAQSKVALLSWDRDGVGSPVQTGSGGMAGGPILGKEAGGGRGARGTESVPGSPGPVPGHSRVPPGRGPLGVRWLRPGGCSSSQKRRGTLSVHLPPTGALQPRPRGPPRPRPRPPACRPPADREAVTDQGHSAAAASSCGRGNIGAPDPGAHHGRAPGPGGQAGPPPARAHLSWRRHGARPAGPGPSPCRRPPVRLPVRRRPTRFAPPLPGRPLPHGRPRCGVGGFPATAPTRPH